MGCYMEKIKNNQLLKSVLLIAITLTILVSAFAMLLNTKNKNKVLADSVDTNYTFSSNGFITPCILTDGVNYNIQADVCFSVNLSKNVFQITCKDLTHNITAGYQPITPTIGGYDTFVFFPVEFRSQYAMISYYMLNTQFNGNVVRFEYHISEISSISDEYTAQYGNKFIQIKYFDNNNELFGFYVLVPNGVDLPVDISPKKYYFVGEFADNEYYQNGYSVGYNTGVDDGYNDGYANGLSVGNSQGYNTGYNAGLADANDYTFLGLIGAVIDAPIKAFYGLFNFEILGTNIASFITAILTLAITIFVIRFALGKGD